MIPLFQIRVIRVNPRKKGAKRKLDSQSNIQIRKCESVLLPYLKAH